MIAVIRYLQYLFLSLPSQKNQQKHKVCVKGHQIKPKTPRILPRLDRAPRFWNSWINHCLGYMYERFVTIRLCRYIRHFFQNISWIDLIDLILLELILLYTCIYIYKRFEHKFLQLTRFSPFLDCVRSIGLIFGLKSSIIRCHKV